MVRVKNPPPGGRATRRPGRFHTKIGKGGAFIVSKWPRKRGTPKSEAVRENNRQFALAQRAANEAFYWFWLEAENMATGTIWNRREILVKAAQGSLWEIVLDDGSFYGNWFALAKEIQALLDTVTDEVGSLLVRRSAGWEALVPGADGYILTSNGPDFAPSWKAGESPPSFYQWSSCQPSGTFTGSDLFVGSDFWPAVDVEITNIAFKLTTTASQTYHLKILELNTSDRIVEILQDFDITTAVYGASGAPDISLPVVQLFEKGKRYAVIVGKQNAGASGGISFARSRGEGFPIPCMDTSLIIRTSIQSLAINDLMFETGQAGFFNMKWRQV